MNIKKIIVGSVLSVAGCLSIAATSVATEVKVINGESTVVPVTVKQESKCDGLLHDLVHPGCYFKKHEHHTRNHEAKKHTNKQLAHGQHVSHEHVSRKHSSHEHVARDHKTHKHTAHKHHTKTKKSGEHKEHGGLLYRHRNHEIEYKV